MSQYQASIPSDGQVKPEIQSFFEKFYEISDTPDAHQKYSEQFTKDAKLIMGPTESNGRAGKSKQASGEEYLFLIGQITVRSQPP